MFKLDDQFLKDLGLDQLPEDQKKAFLEHIYSQLELRVGTRLSEGLSDEQLGEFESFVDRDEQKVRNWVATNTPDYANDPTFQQLQAAAPEGTTEIIMLSEYASLKWLAMNRPDYRDVVKAVLEEIKQEIMSNRDAILGNQAT
jgi:hypothetical protein